MGSPAFDDDDRQLARRARAGELQAFEGLVARYERRLFNLALRLLGSRADAEDAVQEAFLRAFAALASFRGDSRFGTWLYRVAVNACHDVLRRRQRERPAAAPWPAEVAGGAGGEDPERSVERGELREAVARALAELPPEYREAVVLRDLHQLSYEEIAAVLGVAVGTVKSRIHRGRQLLRAILAERELLPAPRVQRDDRRGGATAP